MGEDGGGDLERSEGAQRSIYRDFPQFPSIPLNCGKQALLGLLP